MPTWTTTTTGGSWNSPGTTTFDCNLANRQAISQAYQNFINLPILSFIDGLRPALEDAWDDVEIDCTDPACNGGLAGRVIGNLMLICPNTLAGTQARLNAVVLHELVHVTGGSELDSEAIEWAAFAGAGATLPTAGDRTDFSNDPLWNGNPNEVQGDWVIVNRVTGECWAKALAGGGWGGPTPVRGSLLFTNASFTF